MQTHLTVGGVQLHDSMQFFQGILKSSLKGNYRLPALCFGDLMESMSVLNLEDYEVSQVEPLHDLKAISEMYGIFYLFICPRNPKTFYKRKYLWH